MAITKPARFASARSGSWGSPSVPPCAGDDRHLLGTMFGIAGALPEGRKSTIPVAHGRNGSGLPVRGARFPSASSSSRCQIASPR